MLALADAIVVTTDSVSMVSEAVATSRPSCWRGCPAIPAGTGCSPGAAGRTAGPPICRPAGGVAGLPDERHAPGRRGNVPATGHSRIPCCELKPSMPVPAAMSSTRRWRTRWPPSARRLSRRLQAPLAIYDPDGLAGPLLALHPSIPRAGVAVRARHRLVGKTRAGLAARPITELPRSGARTVLVAAFDAARAAARIGHLLPPGAGLLTLDEIRLPEATADQPGALPRQAEFRHQLRLLP